jgi:hypothetical protein
MAFPLRPEVTEADLDARHRALRRKRLVRVYRAKGEDFGEIKDFLRTQPRNRSGRRIMKCPPPPKSRETKAQRNERTRPSGGIRGSPGESRGTAGSPGGSGGVVSSHPHPHQDPHPSHRKDPPSTKGPGSRGARTKGTKEKRAAFESLPEKCGTCHEGALRDPEGKIKGTCPDCKTGRRRARRIRESRDLERESERRREEDSHLPRHDGGPRSIGEVLKEAAASKDDVNDRKAEK